MQEMCFQSDKELINQILTFSDFSVHHAEEEDLVNENKMIKKAWNDMIIVLEPSQDFRYVYVDSFHLNPIQIIFMFYPSIAVNSNTPFRMSVGAPILFSSLFIESLNVTRLDLTDWVSQLYIQQGLAIGGISPSQCNQWPCYWTIGPLSGRTV